MRTLIALALVGCTYNIVPPPQPARTVCQGSAFGYSSGRYAYATSSGGCVQLPADQCWREPYSDFCRFSEAQRLENNRAEEARRSRDHVILGVSTLVILGVGAGLALAASP
jgi:hypothetical protein